eukprot:TRINITY_DN3937_c0_g1_i6.p1 TRINITY_DN3937_c0_g1~~TRINITY_DN3937_c0_g1_i6.p1  ORF type:complete len:273 (+),score=55.16 TRINITY_DN3937_c0_g1_i6:32-820(+)
MEEEEVVVEGCSGKCTLPGCHSLISQGAEARIFRATFCGRPAVVKERFQKRYRHPSLDEKISIRRLHGEVRSMLKARKLGVSTPTVYAVDAVRRTITLERIKGHCVSDLLLQLSGGESEEKIAAKVARMIGQAVAKLHDGGLIHGDLTASNMILRGSHGFVAQEVSSSGAVENETWEGQGSECKPQLVMIDFSLAFSSTIAEDKAMDLFTLERSLLAFLPSKHGNIMEQVVDSYRRSSRLWSPTLNRLAHVRMRGRKRAAED